MTHLQQHMVTRTTTESLNITNPTEMYVRFAPWDQPHEWVLLQ